MGVIQQILAVVGCAVLVLPLLVVSAYLVIDRYYHMKTQFYVGVTGGILESVAELLRSAESTKKGDKSE